MTKTILIVLLLILAFKLGQWFERPTAEHRGYYQAIKWGTSKDYVNGYYDGLMLYLKVLTWQEVKPCE